MTTFTTSWDPTFPVKLKADTDNEPPDMLGGQDVEMLEKQTVPVRTAWTETFPGRTVINDIIIHSMTVDATALLRRLIKLMGNARFISAYREMPGPRETPVDS